MNRSASFLVFFVSEARLQMKTCQVYFLQGESGEYTFKFLFYVKKKKKKSSGNVFCFCTQHFENTREAGGRRVGKTCLQWVDKITETPPDIMQSDATPAIKIYIYIYIKKITIEVNQLKCNFVNLTQKKKKKLQGYCIGLHRTVTCCIVTFCSPYVEVLLTVRVSPQYEGLFPICIFFSHLFEA